MQIVGGEDLVVKNSEEWLQRTIEKIKIE